MGYNLSSFSERALTSGKPAKKPLNQLPQKRQPPGNQQREQLYEKNRRQQPLSSINALPMALRMAPLPLCWRTLALGIGIGMMVESRNAAPDVANGDINAQMITFVNDNPQLILDPVRSYSAWMEREARDQASTSCVPMTATLSWVIPMAMSPSMNSVIITAAIARQLQHADGTGASG